MKVKAKEVESVCVYCGLACKLKYVVKDNQILRVLPNNKDEVSKGVPCVKGLTINEIVSSQNRILKPLIRESKKKEFEKVTYDYLIEYLKEKFANVDENEVFFNGSGKVTNEANYIIQKFARIVIGTNNIDSCCSRLCHQSTVEALKSSFGIPANPWKISDIEKVDTLLIIGSNPSSNYPSLFSRIIKRKGNGKLKIVVIDVFKSETSSFADFFIKISPGSEVVLFNAIANYLLRYKFYNKKIEGYENFASFKKSVSKYTSNVVEKICNIKKENFFNLLKLIIESKKLGFIHGMGLTQKVNGIENVYALNNLVLLTDGILLSCRGQINVQGSGEMLCKPFIDIASINLKEFEKIYGSEILKRRGKNLIEAFFLSPCKFFVINNFNPALSLPALKKVWKLLRKSFVIQFESFFNETSKFANVIVPSPLLIEREGTITNGERRVRYVRKVIESNLIDEIKIFCEIARKLGFGSKFSYKNVKEISKEISKVISAYKKVNFSLVYKGFDAFADKKIKHRRFFPVVWEGVETKSKKYPFILVTRRCKYSFLTNEATSQSKTLQKLQEGKDRFFISDEDAKKLKLKDNSVIEVESQEGKIRGKVKISKEVPKGIVIAYFHFDTLKINKIVPLIFDEETFQPSFKNIPVRIKKVK